MIDTRDKYALARPILEERFRPGPTGCCFVLFASGLPRVSWYPYSELALGYGPCGSG
jgi:hypothetical protein